MDCTEFNLLTADLCREFPVSACLRQEALTHADSCERCAARLRSERSLALALRFWAEADLAEGAPERVEANLQTAFAMTHPRRAAGWNRLLWVAGVAAAVTFAVLGVRFAVLSRSMVSHSRQTNRRVPVRPKMARPAAPELARQEPAIPVPGSHQLQPAGNLSAAGVLAPDFLKLPGADEDMPIGDGEVVRVEMSGSELVRAGVPMETNYSAQPVVADVLVDQNGTARAIRLVSTPEARAR